MPASTFFPRKTQPSQHYSAEKCSLLYLIPLKNVEIYDYNKNKCNETRILTY